MHSLRCAQLKAGTAQGTYILSAGCCYCCCLHCLAEVHAQNSSYHTHTHTHTLLKHRLLIIPICISTSLGACLLPA
eukprot:scaffold27049_cov22-Tisochrysis_lutea.AAC.1